MRRVSLNLRHNAWRHYETQKGVAKTVEEDNDNTYVEEGVEDFSRKKFDKLARPYL